MKSVTWIRFARREEMPPHAPASPRFAQVRPRRVGGHDRPHAKPTEKRFVWGLLGDTGPGWKAQKHFLKISAVEPVTFTKWFGWL